ncbi:MAG: response regulator transcription factor [Chitinophagaceae bacterium]|nr:response regulator transcription factor [Chitinophagaceae bacterium]
MIRILIVDDEPSAANILQLLIEKNISGISEIKTCTDPQLALKLIHEYQPSLLMLDIEMPYMNGFDLLNRVGSWNFDVVFTTAYDKYAIKAIRFSALDYLLKPIDLVDLKNAVGRHIIKKEQQPVSQELLVNNLISNLQQKDATSFKLALSTQEGYYFYEAKDILRCEGENNYTHFYFINSKPLIVSRTLKEFEEILSDHGFIRVHKSHLVNSAHITRFDKEGLLWFPDGSNVTVSRRKKEEVLRALHEKKSR